ncbi:MAG: hypothetical protein H6595_02290 [Flavobacteriales bacterium]|nr:hypothetical protein [Flavobacteriales bacterium]MCB9166288.1 hypothetical protein [Flavobacteriales bacterium]
MTSLFRITNYDDHPSDANWIVFRFNDRGIASEFHEELDRAAIACELDESEEAPHLIAVKQRHRETAIRLNYLVLGRHRSPFMADPLLRWTVVGLVVLALVLALVGALLG